MKIALGQFAVVRDWRINLEKCVEWMLRSDREGAGVLVLPEAVLARDISNPMIVLSEAQPIDGPFMTAMLAASLNLSIATVFTIHVPAKEGKVTNTLIVIQAGKIIAKYDKLHLYDAFSVKESESTIAGGEIPPLVEIEGFKFGLMTCYDLRFPELARSLALSGADVLLLPAAWLKGSQKEHHWKVLSTARALENTCYMVSVGECGPQNIGNSLVVDPLGIVILQLPETEKLDFVHLDKERIQSVREQVPILKNTCFNMPTLKNTSNK